LACHSVFNVLLRIVTHPAQSALLAPWKQARQLANDMVKQAGLGVGDAISMLDQQAAMFITVDSTFKLEIAVASALASDGASHRIESLLLGMIPNKDSKKSAAEVHSCVAKLKACSGHVF
jgi:hypothetical protein